MLYTHALFYVLLVYPYYFGIPSYPIVLPHIGMPYLIGALFVYLFGVLCGVALCSIVCPIVSPHSAYLISRFSLWCVGLLYRFAPSFWYTLAIVLMLYLYALLSCTIRLVLSGAPYSWCAYILGVWSWGFMVSLFNGFPSCAVSW